MFFQNPLGLNNSTNAKLISFDVKPLGLTKPLAQESDISWSSISELLGKSYTTENGTVAKKNESTHLSFSSPFVLHSPDSETPDIALSNPNREISQELTTELLPKNSLIENEQFAILAQNVYALMRQWLEITQERYGIKVVENPIGLNKITSNYKTSVQFKPAPDRLKSGQITASNYAIFSQLDGNLQQLTQKISWLIQERFEIERERRGRYYVGRLPW